MATSGDLLIEPMRLDKPEGIRSWFERLEQSMQVMFAHGGVTGERLGEQAGLKKSYLISNIGELAYEVLKSYCAPDIPVDKTYDEMKTLMVDNIAPQPSALTEGYTFSGMKQESGESLALFMSRLKTKAARCNFGVL